MLACVCVCVSTPGQRVLHRHLLHRFFHDFPHAGGHSSFHQSVANEATDDWRGYEPGTPGSRTCSPFPTVDKLSNLAFLVFMVLHDTFPQTYSSPAAVPLIGSSECLRQQCFNNTFQRTLPPCRSITIFDLGTEFTEYKCQSVFRSAVPLGC